MVISRLKKKYYQRKETSRIRNVLVEYPKFVQNLALNIKGICIENAVPLADLIHNGNHSSYFNSEDIRQRKASGDIDNIQETSALRYYHENSFNMLIDKISRSSFNNQWEFFDRYSERSKQVQSNNEMGEISVLRKAVEKMIFNSSTKQLVNLYNLGDMNYGNLISQDFLMYSLIKKKVKDTNVSDLEERLSPVNKFWAVVRENYNPNLPLELTKKIIIYEPRNEKKEESLSCF